MADTITSSHTLNIGLEYIDPETSDTKNATLKMSNPKDNITKADVQAAFNTQIFIYGVDEEEGVPLYFDSDSVLTASTTDQTINNLDIGWVD